MLLENFKELSDNFESKIRIIFNDLVKKSKIDVEANRKSMNEYDELSNQKENLQKDLRWNKIITVVIIITEILLGIFVSNFRNQYKYNHSFLSFFSFLITGSCFLFLIHVYFNYVSPRKKDLESKVSSIETDLKALEDICQSQVSDLFKFFKSNVANEVITSILPELKLDRYFDNRRYEKLMNNYDLGVELNNEASAFDILSGEFLGNPFIMLKALWYEEKLETYGGSLSVSWTEEYFENGERKTRPHSETLRASVSKPKPFFHKSISLIFGNEAAPNLSFSRAPNFIHNMTEKKLEKFTKKAIKRVKEASKEAARNGKTFVEMDNLEFDGLFGALDRDHETEFRALFTPLAQENMLKLMKNSDFGDDFFINKKKKHITVFNDINWTMNIHRKNYHHFSLKEIENRYVNYNLAYFKNFCKLFSPILAIPTYQQQKTDEYIYTENFDSNYNPYIAEMLANNLGELAFKHPESGTPAILKTKFLRKEKDVDLYEITAYSYKTISRSTSVYERASNGRNYSVPVTWTEYIPVTAHGKMEVKRTELEENEFENIAAASNEEEIVNGNYSFKDKFFVLLNKSEDLRTPHIFK